MDNKNRNIEEVAVKEVVKTSRFSRKKKIVTACGIVLGGLVLAITKAVSDRRVADAEAEYYEDRTEDAEDVDIESEVE